MKTMLEQNTQSHLEARDSVLCIVVETPRPRLLPPGCGNGSESKSPTPTRPVRNIDPQEGLFIDEEGTAITSRISFLSESARARAIHAGVVAAIGGPNKTLSAVFPGAVVRSLTDAL